MVPSHHIVTLVTLLLLLSTLSHAVSDIYGNLLSDDDHRYPKLGCCIVPTCNKPGECYKMVSCGHVCSSGKYPPAEYSTTPGYRLKTSYFRYDCRFGECRYYEFKCNHCQNPREADFSYSLVREDCKECYYR